MGSSQYASSFGRLQSIAINFLSEDFLQNMLKANNVTEMVKQLESTWYGEEIKKAASVYKDAALLEVALNRTLLKLTELFQKQHHLQVKMQLELIFQNGIFIILN